MNVPLFVRAHRPRFLPVPLRHAKVRAIDVQVVMKHEKQVSKKAGEVGDRRLHHARLRVGVRGQPSDQVICALRIALMDTRCGTHQILRQPAPTIDLGTADKLDCDLNVRGKHGHGER